MSTNEEIRVLEWVLKQQQEHMAVDDSDIDFDYIPVEVVEERLRQLVKVTIKTGG